MPKNLKELGLTVNNKQKVFTEISDQLSKAYEFKDNLMANEDATPEQLKNASNKVNSLKAKVGIAKEDFKEAQLALTSAQKVPVNKIPGSDGVQNKAQFGSDVYNLAKGHFDEISNLAKESDDDSFALTIPVDQQTKIDETRMQRTDLSLEFNHEAVSTLTGTRVVQSNTDLIPMQNLDDGGEISQVDLNNLKKISYTIGTWATATAFTNNLLSDSKENIQAYTINWVALSQRLGRSQSGIKAMNKKFVASNDSSGKTIEPEKTLIKISKFDDILDLVMPGVTLDGGVTTSSNAKMFTTNTGFATLSKVKDAKGDYILQPDPTNQDIYRIKGKQVVAIEDSLFKDKDGKWLFTGLSKNSQPIIFGDLKYAVTLYDRMAGRIDLDNSIGFLSNSVTVRFLDRFDTVVVHPDGFAVGSFINIDDQVPVIKQSDNKPDGGDK